MPRGYQRDGKLTPQDAAFASMLARGYTQADAYRAVYQVKPDATANSIYVSASEKAKQPKIQVRVRELLEAARLEDIMSAQGWYRAVLDDIELSRDKGNLTAVMSGQRMIGQSLGALRERGVELHVGSDVSDTALIERLANGDPDKAKMLRGLLGQDDFTPAD